ncbi:MAG: PIN domain-containing protein [Lysobacterales bacterium]
MRTNYVLIDYENVQPKNLALLSQEHFRVIVFIGANQRSLRGILAPCRSSGLRRPNMSKSADRPNALDFHIAYYIGSPSHQTKMRSSTSSARTLGSIHHCPPEVAQSVLSTVHPYGDIPLPGR